LLAQSLINRTYFPYCSSKALKWSFRKANLLNELKSYAPDIACFQELEFSEDWKKALKELGYEGVTKPRGGKKQDGCGIFFKSHRFRLLETREIEFDKLAGNIAELHTLNVGQIVVLEFVDGEPGRTKNGLIVANHHLYYKPAFTGWKTLQACHTLREVATLRKQYPSFPAFVCGGKIARVFRAKASVLFFSRLPASLEKKTGTHCHPIPSIQSCKRRTSHPSSCLHSSFRGK